MTTFNTRTVFKGKFWNFLLKVLNVTWEFKKLVWRLVNESQSSCRCNSCHYEAGVNTGFAKWKIRMWNMIRIIYVGYNHILQYLILELFFPKANFGKAILIVLNVSCVDTRIIMVWVLKTSHTNIHENRYLTLNGFQRQLLEFP